MKGRLIKKDKQLLFLSQDGKIREADKDLLYNILFGFKNIKLSDKYIGIWNEEIPEMSSYEGITLCYITDSNQLVILEPEAFQKLFVSVETKIERLLTVKEYAEQNDKSEARIKKMCAEGLLKCQKLGGVWFIEPQPFPIDKRVKTGKYLKK